MSKIKAIEEYGRSFVERFLNKQVAERKSLLLDKDKAIIFLFSKIFYRGRRDELSHRFMKAALQTLGEYKPKKGCSHQVFDGCLKSNGVNNGKDRRMVMEIFDFIFKLDSCKNNIVMWSVNEIK